MAYNLEEQDQIDALKAWWTRHGTNVLLVLGLAIAGVVGYQGWERYQASHTAAASSQFMLLGDTSPDDVEGVQRLAGEIIEKYPSTPYAARAALLAAKVNYNAKDVESAKSQSEWAYKNAREPAVKTLAQLQLAAIHFDLKDYDAALALLAAKHEPSFDGLFADLKGDVLVAQDKRDEAKLAYNEALNSFGPGSHYARYTEHKLEALGE